MLEKFDSRLVEEREGERVSDHLVPMSSSS
jgi:hypothetical protein